MIEPYLKDDAFLMDVKQSRGRLGLRAWWLGQSGFLVQFQNAHLLIDPYLSDSLTKKYAESDTPHVRMTARVIDPARLDFIDVATSSHNHTDHLDAETLIPLLEVNPELTLIVPQANLTFAAQRLNLSPERITGIRLANPVQVGPFTFHAIPAAHETIENDATGEPRHIGLVIQAGGWTLYHSGDCVPYPGLVDQLSKWTIDLALLPINGRDPERGVPGNFSIDEAARLARDINAGLVVPMHYEMFEFNSVSPKRFAGAAKRLGQPHYTLRAGERLVLS